MSAYVLSALMGAAALAVIVVSVLRYAQAKAKIARRTGALNERIARAKEQMQQARERAAAGLISPERLDDVERHISVKLLEGDMRTAGLQINRIVATNRLALAGAGALLLTSLAIGLAVLGGRAGKSPVAEAPAATDATAPPSADAASAAASAGGVSRALTEPQLQRMIEQASASVQRDPRDAAAWSMLAHTYDMLGKFAESSKAYAKLVVLLPKDAQVLADYADALAVASDRSLEGEPAKLIERALKADPRNSKALALSGTAAFERGAYAEAVDYWQRARATSNEPSFTRQLDASIGEAKAALAGTPAAVAEPLAATPASGVAHQAATISGRVTLADDLLPKTRPDAIVFIFARPAKGSRMPVAILRKRVRDLPANFTLDDSMAMVPDVKLSRQSSVVVGARVSMRGDVMPQAGDMQGWSAPVKIGATGLRLEISEVLK